MQFEPIDEMSLRHLFSSKLGEESLQFAYIGPVLDTAGNIQSSPDCLILDRRVSPHRTLRCEFKFKPSSAAEFAHNGFFDIAIIWALSTAMSKKKLEEDLLIQNRCTEILILSENILFSRLPAYNFDSPTTMGQMGVVTKLALRRDESSVVAAYIAAAIYPKAFDSTRLLDFLRKKFPTVEKMRPQGRANVIAAWLQTSPPLIDRLHQNYYLWNRKISHIIAKNELADFIVNKIRIPLPDPNEYQYVIKD